jgi:hypothetical protein
MTRQFGQDQPVKVQPPDRPEGVPDAPPPPGPLAIFTGELSEDEMRQIRNRFVAAQGRPASALWYPIAPYEVTLVEGPRRSWWRRLLNLPAKADQ